MTLTPPHSHSYKISSFMLKALVQREMFLKYNEAAYAKQTFQAYLLVFSVPHAFALPVVSLSAPFLICLSLPWGIYVV